MEPMIWDKEGLLVHCQMSVLRVLLEGMLAAMPTEQREQALETFSFKSKALAAELLAAGGRDLVAQHLERAVRVQQERLKKAGLQVPEDAPPA